jgi:hypothetical protein
MSKRPLDISQKAFVEAVRTSKNSDGNVGPLSLTVQSTIVSNHEFIRNGTILIGYPLDSTVVVFDPETFNSVAKKEAETKENSSNTETSKILNRVSMHHLSSRKPENVSEAFRDLSNFNRQMTVIGVRADDPAGYVSKSQGTFQNLATIQEMAVAVKNRQQIFSGYFKDSLSGPIFPGARLWAIIKKVPSPTKDNPKNMAVHIMFYACKLGEVRPPIDVWPYSAPSRYDQPSIFSPEYNEFEPHVKPPVPGTKYNQRLKDATCILLGAAINYFPYTSNTQTLSSSASSTISSPPEYSQKSIITSAPLDVHLSIKHFFK